MKSISCAAPQNPKLTVTLSLHSSNKQTKPPGWNLSNSNGTSRNAGTQLTHCVLLALSSARWEKKGKRKVQPQNGNNISCWELQKVRVFHLWPTGQKVKHQARSAAQHPRSTGVLNSPALPRQWQQHTSIWWDNHEPRCSANGRHIWTFVPLPVWKLWAHPIF